MNEELLIEKLDFISLLLGMILCGIGVICGLMLRRAK